MSRHIKLAIRSKKIGKPAIKKPALNRGIGSWAPKIMRACRIQHDTPTISMDGGSSAPPPSPIMNLEEAFREQPGRHFAYEVLDDGTVLITEMFKQQVTTDSL